MKIRYPILIASCLCFVPCFAQKIYNLEPVVVTSSRIGSHLCMGIREVIILEREDVSLLPAQSICELLKYISSVDLKRRGIGGIQSDFAIRGSTFEQVLILIDGVRINDPQTGHHNSDIPLDVSDIERIEIVPGHCSSIYGSEGFGGVINIITRVPRKSSSSLSITTGSFGTYSGLISNSFCSGNIRSRLTVKREASSGYRPDSDYDLFNSSFHSNISLKRGMIDFFLGWIEKDFGANGFYANFPSRENTSSFNTAIGLVHQLSNPVVIKYRLFNRIHRDKFVLDYNRPEWYKNRHRTSVSGCELQANIDLKSQRQIAVGLDLLEESIVSSNLGERKRYRMGYYLEILYPVRKNLVIDLSTRCDQQSRWGIEFSPSISLEYRMGSKISWHTSVGRVFRAPTFTEMYYTSPANIGDPDLKPEWGWSAETGLNLDGEYNSHKINLFIRDEYDLIDWVTDQIGKPWKVMNIGRVWCAGVSVGGRCRINSHLRLNYGYTFIEKRNLKKSRYISKYGFNVLRHNLSLIALIKWSRIINQSLILQIKNRDSDNSYVILDSKFSFTLRNFKTFIEFSNILNVFYEEIPGVPMPGRALMAGIGLNI